MMLERWFTMNMTTNDNTTAALDPKAVAYYASLSDYELSDSLRNRSANPPKGARQKRFYAAALAEASKRGLI